MIEEWSGTVVFYKIGYHTIGYKMSVNYKRKKKMKIIFLIMSFYNYFYLCKKLFYFFKL